VSKRREKRAPGGLVVFVGKGRGKGDGLFLEITRKRDIR